VGKWIREKLFSRADRVLMMSATILNVSTFLESVGVDPSEALFLRCGSSFPVENRLIHVVPVADLSYAAQGRDLPALTDAMGLVLDEYPEERGIIHTHSYAVTQAVEQNLRYSHGERLLVQGKKTRRDELLARHEKMGNGVLVAPAMHQGLDLKDELCRVSIMAKVPYPSMKDPQIAARMKVDQGWYGWLTALKLVQSYGRGTRSMVDYSDTVVLDKSFMSFVRRNRATLPTWFTEAIREHATMADCVKALRASRAKRVTAALSVPA